MYIRSILICGIAFTVLAMAEGAAQPSAPLQPTRVPVTLVLVSDLPPADGAFRVERRAVEPHDVILVRADATTDQLSDAVRTLLIIRQVDGDTARTHLGAMRMRPHQAHAGPRREFPWIGRVLADLRRAEPQEVLGVGRVRAVKIWLPRQSRPARR